MLGVPGLSLAAQPAQRQLPERFDISDLMTPVRDQGERMTCAAFALVASAEALIARDKGQQVMLSEEYLLHMHYAGRPRPADESMDVGNLFEVAAQHGFARAEDWPYQPKICPSGSQEPGCPVTPPDIPAIASRAVRLPDYGWVASRINVAYSNEDRIDVRARNLALTIAFSRMAPIFGAVYPADYQGWPDDGVLSVPDIAVGLTEDEALELPAHFAVLTGYDFARREFYFKNSWGEGWGRKGYGVLPFSVINSPAFHPFVLQAARKRRVTS